MSWSERVRSLMATKKINQKQLSQMSGITEASVSRYLRGDRTPRMDVIVNFSKALGVTAEFLLGREESENEKLFTNIATAIARNGNKLSPEEKNRLISLILSAED